jgi:2'-5' RNA ligase
MNGKPRSSGDYRTFVGAFPTGKVIERIQALRQRYDAKTACITAPHVTLAGTYWCIGQATQENETEAIANRVIYLHVEPTDNLLAARQTLLEALEPDKHRRFVPHLTLAMRLGWDETRSLLARLQQSEWHTGRWSVPIDHLWLMQRGPGDPAWRYIHRIDLTGA